MKTRSDLQQLTQRKGMEDRMEIKILRDGTLKITTDKISMENHVVAEGLIAAIISKAGGNVEQTAKDPTVQNAITNQISH